MQNSSTTCSTGSTCCWCLVIQLIVDVFAAFHVATGVKVGAVAQTRVSPGKDEPPEVQLVTRHRSQMRSAAKANIRCSLNGCTGKQWTLAIQKTYRRVFLYWRLSAKFLETPLFAKTVTASRSHKRCNLGVVCVHDHKRIRCRTSLA